MGEIGRIHLQAQCQQHQGHGHSAHLLYIIVSLLNVFKITFQLFNADQAGHFFGHDQFKCFVKIISRQQKSSASKKSFFLPQWSVEYCVMPQCLLALALAYTGAFYPQETISVSCGGRICVLWTHLHYFF